MKRTRLRLSVLSLILTLTALPAFAGNRAPRPAKTPSLLACVWQALGRFIPAVAAGRAGMDPNGSPGDGTTTTSTTPPPEDDSDGRGTMDPDGSDPNG